MIRSKISCSTSCKDWTASTRERMFGGHGLYQDETFFGIIHKGRLYFKTDDHTVAAYRRRKMKPFRPNPKQTLRSYYQVPVEIIEDGDRLGAWAEAAIRCQRKKD